MSTTLARRDDNKLVAGVCSGLAETLRMDVTIVRVAFVVLSLMAGVGLIPYIVLWAVMPRRQGGSAAEDGLRRAKQWYDGRQV